MLATLFNVFFFYLGPVFQTTKWAAQIVDMLHFKWIPWLKCVVFFFLRRRGMSLCVAEGYRAAWRMLTDRWALFRSGSGSYLPPPTLLCARGLVLRVDQSGAPVWTPGANPKRRQSNGTRKKKGSNLLVFLWMGNQTQTIIICSEECSLR